MRAQGPDRVLGRTGDRRRLPTPARLLQPRRHQLQERVGDGAIGVLRCRLAQLHPVEAGRGELGEVGTVRPVHRHRVRRLPRSERERRIDDETVDRVIDDDVAPDQPLVSDEGPQRRVRDAAQVGPGVGRGRNLPQRPVPEPARTGTDHLDRVGAGRIEGHPVLGELGGTPDLFSPVHRFATPIPHEAETVPLARRDHSVDESDEAVEVARLHEFGESRLVHHQRRSREDVMRSFKPPGPLRSLSRVDTRCPPAPP